MLIGILTKLGRQLLYGGSPHFRGYEAAIIEATLSALSSADRDALTVQVNARERVQRWNSDRMVIFGFGDRGDLPALSVTAEDHRLAKLKLCHAAGCLTANLMTHRGLLSSIEFSKSPTALGSTEFRIESIRLHPSHPGHSAAIDQEEHLEREP